MNDSYVTAVELPYNGHFGTVLTCPLYGGIPYWEGQNTVVWKIFV